MFFKNKKKVTKVEKLNLSIKINDEFLKIISGIYESSGTP